MPDLPPLREQVRQEHAAAQQRAELERVLGELDEQLTRGELSAASDLLNAAAALSPTDGRVRRCADAPNRRSRRGRPPRPARETSRKKVTPPKRCSGRAIWMGRCGCWRWRRISTLSTLEPSRSRARVTDAIKARDAAEAAERLRQTVDELLAGAEAQLQSPDRQTPAVMLAMQQIAKAQELAPDNTRAAALKATADEALAALRESARVDAAIRNARSRFANGKHQAALQLLESFDASAHPAVAETLKELRAQIQAIQEQRRAEQEQAERQARVAELLKTARAAIEGKRLNEALEALLAARAIDATADGLVELTDQAIRSQTQETRKTSAVCAGRNARPRTDADGPPARRTPPGCRQTRKRRCSSRPAEWAPTSEALTKATRARSARGQWESRTGSGRRSASILTKRRLGPGAGE